MLLRKLEKEDASKMLAWMHDDNVVANLPTLFENMDIEDCYKFIEQAQNDSANVHMAICSDDNSYLGTVSLKNIDYKNLNAEYAITISREAMGKGVSLYATEEILKVAFHELKLNKVYLCVFSDNIRAKKFYNKLNLNYEGTWKQHCLHKDGKYHDLEWYGIVVSEYEEHGIGQESKFNI